MDNQAAFLQIAEIQVATFKNLRAWTAREIDMMHYVDEKLLKDDRNSRIILMLRGAMTRPHVG